MSEETQEVEDIIEDVTEEQLTANEELEQDLPEEVSEEAEAEASFDDSIKSILLGEKKAVKKEEEDEEEESEEEDEEEEMEEGYMKASKSKKEESDEEEEEDEDEEEMEEAAKVEDEVDGEKVSVGVSQAIKKSAKAKAPEPTGKGPQTDDSEQDGEKAIDDTVKSIKKSTPAKKAKVAEALDLLMTNQAELSEDFKTEAATLFEAAIAEKSLEIQERLEEKYNQERVEEVEALRESLIERIDSYLSYVVESWIEENTEQVENTLRTEIAENFISSLKDVFVENYIEVPTEKRDIVEELNTVAEETQEKLSESEKQVEALKEQIEAYERNEVLAEASSDLSENESTKLTAIVEDIEFTDKETFASKVGVIKSSLFNIKEESTLQDSVEDYQNAETEVIIEGEADPMEKLPSYMKAYVSALSSSK
jgi:hypothetical protein